MSGGVCASLCGGTQTPTQGGTQRVALKGWHSKGGTHRVALTGWHSQGGTDPHRPALIGWHRPAPIGWHRPAPIGWHRPAPIEWHLSLIHI